MARIFTAPTWLLTLLVIVVAAVLFIPWQEPARRAERLIRAFRSQKDDANKELQE